MEIIRHQPVGPGEVALGPFADEARRPTRGVRPRTAAEVAFLGLGGAAEAFLRAAAAAGTLRLEAELAGIVALDVAWGREALRRALERATTLPTVHGRRRAGHPRGRAGVPEPTRAGGPLALELPAVSERPLSAYALTQLALPSISTTGARRRWRPGPVGGRA